MTSDATPYSEALDDFVALGATLEKSFAGLRSEPEDAIVDELRTAEERLISISDRVRSLPPLSESGRQALLTKFRSEPAFQADGLQEQADNLRRVIAGLGRAAQRRYNRFAAHFQGTQNALADSVTKWRPPRNFVEEVEFGLWDTHRQVLAATLTADSGADYSQLAARIRSIDSWLAELIAARRSFLRSNIPFKESSDYGSAFGAVKVALTRQISKLDERHKSDLVDQAYADFLATAESASNVAEAIAQEAEREKKERADRIVRERAEAVKECIEFERQRSTPDQFVVIRLDRAIPIRDIKSVQDQLKSTLKIQKARVCLAIDQAAVTLTYPGPIQDVAKAITFGKVIATDPSSRVLDVRVTLVDEFAKEVEENKRKFLEGMSEESRAFFEDD